MTEHKDNTQKRKLSAIMFTDIKGFSSIMENDEITAVGLVKTQREIVRRHIANYNGEERETIGDAFLVIFDSAVNAVRAAIDIQREIWEYNQTRESQKQVWIRIGIHLGDILIEEGSVFGEGVNLAARVEPLAEPGGICITRPVYEQVKHHLDISISHLLVRELKNITDIPDIYRIRLSTTAPAEPISIKEYLGRIKYHPVAFTLAMCAVVLIIAANIYWNFFALHKSYARNVTFVRHAPQMFQELSRNETKTLDHYYEATTRGRKIIKLVEISKSKTPLEDTAHSWEFQLAKKPKRNFPVHEYTYAEDNVKEESVYDSQNTFQYKLIYEQNGASATAHDRAGFIKTFENQIAGFGYEFDENGRTIRLENRNAFGIPRTDAQGIATYQYTYNSDNLPVETGSYNAHGNPIENKDGIAVLVNEYNDKGLLQKETFLDRYKNIKESTNGIASISRTFDDLGRVITEQYGDRANQPTTDNVGVCSKKFIYDKNGLPKEITTLSCSGNPKASREGYATVKFDYNPDGLVIKKSYFDENGEPSSDDDGIAIITTEYDKNSRVSFVAFFDPQDEPTTNKQHVHAVNYVYDNLGRPSGRSYLDLENKPTISSDGYSQVKIQYNDRDDATEWAYFDTDGTFINGKDGIAIVKNEYDQYGNIVSRSFFDKHSKPAIGREEACHRIQTKYDEKGDLDETRCFDNEENLTPGLKHCAISQYDFDTFGKLTRFDCFVTEGVLIDEPNLPSVLTIKYDNYGNVSEVKAHNAKNELAERYEGAAIWKRTADKFGNELEISTYDRNERLIINPKYKAAIFRREFDDFGHPLKAQSFDQDGHPSKGIWGFAEIRYDYDGRGNKISEAYFDERGAPTHDWQNVHEYRTSYDKYGRVSQVTNIGEAGTPSPNGEGVTFAAYEYNPWGQLIKTSYFDPDRKLVLNKRLHCASQEFSIDDRGNILEIKRFDTDGKICANPKCSGIAKQKFNSKGQMLEQHFEDALENPMSDEEGAYGYKFDYDIQGRISTQKVLGRDQKEAADKNGIDEYHIFYKPESGKKWFMTFKSNTGANLRVILYDPIYMDRQRSLVDTSSTGQIVSIKCLDEAGNETPRKDCTTPSEIKSELSKINLDK